MILDFLIVAFTVSVLTFLTANKNNKLSKLKQNSLPSGLLLTITQLMFFISRLDCADAKVLDFYKLVVSVLVRFRPLLIGTLFRIIFEVAEAIKNKQVSEISEKTEVKTNASAFDFSVLSRREIEVARLASKGYTNAQIAECLYISTETVKSHMNSIFEKLGLSSRKDLLGTLLN